MGLKDYLSYKAVTLCFLGIGAVVIGVVIIAAGGSGFLFLILTCLLLFLTALWFITGFFIERNRLARLERLIRELPEKYLLAEVIPTPSGLLEKRYFQIMHEISRSAVAVAEKAERDIEDYRDYVESWIHEIKTPLTACSLILSNGGDPRKLRLQIKRADDLTESILWYARLRTAEKDIKINKFSAAEVIDEAVRGQMEPLIAAGIRVESSGDFMVSSDFKTVCFIIKQLLINCAKYAPGGVVIIKAEKGSITVKDNGPGIPPHELPRVTERGFTGSASAGGTGMGLYIVKELCRKLSILLKIESETGKYTKITLSFDSLTKT